MQGGAVRGGVKRAAFADVSNTNRALQPSKDDSAINGKGSYDGVKPLSIHVQEPLVKITALQKPASRPLPVKTTTTLTQAVTTTVPIKPAASDKALAQVQPAVTRKVIPKLVTASIKEVDSVKQTELPLTCEVKQIEKKSATERVLDQLKENATKEQSPAIDGVLLPYHEPASYESNYTLIAEGPVQPVTLAQRSTHTTISEQVLPGHQQILPGSQAERQVLLALERQAQALESERNVALLSQAAESHQYYDEEEEEELYYDDGYTTARSLEMRGTNTTGGATIVLQPKYTSKIKAELAAAKELVQAALSPDDIEDEQWDTSMVAEYGEEIFDYMRTLEVCTL